MRKFFLLVLALLCLSIILNVILGISVVGGRKRQEILSTQKELCEKKYKIVILALGWLLAQAGLKGSIDENLAYKAVRGAYDDAICIEADEDRKEFLYELYHMTRRYKGESYEEWETHIRSIAPHILEGHWDLAR